MIKAKAVTQDGTSLLLLGLSGENVTRLIAGEPIHIDASELKTMGLPSIHVGIVYGRTEEDIANDIRGHSPGASMSNTKEETDR